MSDADRARRSEVEQRTAALRAQNICPSCHHFATASVFPHTAEQTYYEDDRVSCQLESYPRGIGHTIIIARDHYADIADMPVALGQHMIVVTHTLVNAIKRVTGAEKVYLVTMCSGALSHLHWQLIPRLPGEMIGGRVFASPRGVLTNYHLLRDRLAQETRRNTTFTVPERSNKEYRAMAYSDFSFDILKREFGLNLIEDQALFPEPPIAPVSEALAQLLVRYIPLALNISTEKARSEFIIAPILADLKFQHPDQLSLFSGVDFTVDEQRGLKGPCDYILSRGREQLVVSAPICVLVAAKNEQIVGGIPQCLAEMIAAQEFNTRNGVTISPMYGVVTTGSLWRFLKLIDTTAYVDTTEYPIQQLPYILGILQTITRTP